MERSVRSVWPYKKTPVIAVLEIPEYLRQVPLMTAISEWPAGIITYRIVIASARLSIQYAWLDGCILKSTIIDLIFSERRVYYPFTARRSEAY